MLNIDYTVIQEFGDHWVISLGETWQDRVHVVRVYPDTLEIVQDFENKFEAAQYIQRIGA